MSFLSPTLALPMLAAIMNIKILERLGYINVQYGDSLEAFFDVQANNLVSSSSVSLLDSSATQNTLSEGKISKHIPGFTTASLIKLILFILIYLLRGPIFICKKLA